MTGLSLRCTLPALPDDDAPVDAFHAGGRWRDPELMELLLATRRTDATRQVTLRSAPMPDPEAGWTLPAFPLRMTAAALVLPLALAPVVASAAEPDEPTEETDEPAEETDTESPEGAMPQAGPEQPAPPAPVGPPPVDADLSLQGSILWQSMLGMRLKLYLVDDLRVRGLLLAEAGDQIAIAQDDGAIMRIDKEMVEAARVLDPFPGSSAVARERAKKPKDGRGLLTAGAILTGVGVSLITILPVSRAISYYGAYYTFPFAWIGSAMISPGIPLLALGAAREEKKAALRNRALLGVSGGPTLEGGWSGRLTLTF